MVAETTLKSDTLQTSQQSRPWDWSSWCIVFSAVLASIYVLTRALQWNGIQALKFTGGIIGLMAIATVPFLWRVSLHPGLDKNTGRAWKLLAIALSSYAIGFNLWFLCTYVFGVKFPAFGGVFFLAYYPIILWALLTFPREVTTKREAIKFYIDTGVVMIAATMLAWYFVVGPIAQDGLRNDDVLNLLYVGGDLTLLFGITNILLKRPKAICYRALLIVVCALLFIFAADTIFMYLTMHNAYQNGHWVDALWCIGLFLINFAAFKQYRHATYTEALPQRKSAASNSLNFTWLPYLAICLGYGLLIYVTRDHWSGPVGLAVLGTLALTGLVAARQIAAYFEISELSDEQMRTKSELKFRMLIQDSADVITIVDKKGLFVYQSPSFNTVLGYEEGELLGVHCTEISHPDDIQKVIKDSLILKENPHIEIRREHLIRHKNGSWLVFEGIAKNIYDETGKFAGVLMNSRDITKRKEAELKLKAYAAKLKASNRELQDFAFASSHDLQEPLRKVQAFGDRLKSKYAEALDEEGQDYLNRMQSAAGRMQTLINDLLSFSRITTKAKPFEAVDLEKITREVLSDLEIKIEETGASIVIEDLPKFDADPTQMRQVMQNLIGNALKFHRPGEAPFIRIFGVVSDAGIPEDFCRFAVEDNGIGFEEKYADRIFTVFQRLHGRSEYEGSGIGLAICRKIIERHGGTITAQSAQDKGATFVITLPLRQENIGETNENRD